MSEPRVIKKYPNRRLYDTAVSSYITLEDVKRLVMEGVEFKVIDARSNEDISRNILLQIISEQEEKGSPIFTTPLLEQIIRFYGDTLQGTMSGYLERSLHLFVEQQTAFRDQMNKLMGANPIALMSEMADRNLAMWRSMQENFLAGMSGGRKSSSSTDKSVSPDGKK